MAVAFDTLKAATRLREEAGFDERQARVLVATFAEGIGESLATKEDLGNTETALRNEIRALRKDLESTEATLRTDLENTEATLRTDLGNTETALRTDMANAEAALRKDLENTATALRKDLESTKTALQGQMRELEQRMTVRLGAMIAAAMGIAVALIKLLP